MLCWPLPRTGWYKRNVTFFAPKLASGSTNTKCKIHPDIQTLTEHLFTPLFANKMQNVTGLAEYNACKNLQILQTASILHHYSLSNYDTVWCLIASKHQAWVRARYTRTSAIVCFLCAIHQHRYQLRLESSFRRLKVQLLESLLLQRTPRSSFTGLTHTSRQGKTMIGFGLRILVFISKVGIYHDMHSHHPWEVNHKHNISSWAILQLWNLVLNI